MKKTDKIKNIIISLIIMIGGLALFTPSVLAATKTVCSSGCDYTTVDAAIDAATTGDTITLATGSYAGFTNDGTKNITITKADGVTTLPVITSGVTISSTGSTTITGLNISGTTITASAGTITLLNNKLGSITASGTAAVEAKGNYWNSATPSFTTLITTSDTATVNYTPYYTVESMLGSNITSISLNTASKTLEVGEQYSADITVVSVGDYTITWASSNTNVATVSDGVISAVAIGNATITGTTTYGDVLEIAIEVVAEGTTDNPETSLELYIVAFGALVVIGGYIGIKSYNKSKEMM